jgi:hypothetical protein
MARDLSPYDFRSVWNSAHDADPVRPLANLDDTLDDAAGEDDAPRPRPYDAPGPCEHDSRTCPDCIHLDRHRIVPYAVRGGGVYLSPEALADVLARIDEAIAYQPAEPDIACRWAETAGYREGALDSIRRALGRG